ncbi:MAG: Appr-1-p processing protein [Candidatus Latescibacterota bacterium]|nr:MAG: Appr-1-p processing protein [Candidatus Latescibacterota bacterium]
MKVQIGEKVLEVVRGDITEQEADAIVNAANDHRWMGGGVAGAIKRKGGEEIEKEAVSKGPIPVGEAVVTSAGRLKAKYVIHAAGMGQDLRTDEDKIREATRNALKRAEELKLESVAFPAIGTGVGGFPADRCAEVMIGTALDFLKEAESLRLVRFVLFGEETYEAFLRKLEEVGGS